LAGGLVDSAAEHGIAAFPAELGIALVPPQFKQLQPYFQVGGGGGAVTTEQIAFGQDRGEIAGQSRLTHGLRLEQHVAEPWVQGQGGQLSASGCDPPGRIESAQRLQEFTRLQIRTGSRRVEPAQFAVIGDAPEGQF